jgi:hypothetical protein
MRIQKDLERDLIYIYTTEVGEILEVLVLEYEFVGTRTSTRE